MTDEQQWMSPGAAVPPAAPPVPPIDPRFVGQNPGAGSVYGSGYPGTSGVNSGYGTGTGYAYSPASGYFWGNPWRRPCGGGHAAAAVASAVWANPGRCIA